MFTFLCLKCEQPKSSSSRVAEARMRALQKLTPTQQKLFTGSLPPQENFLERGRRLLLEEQAELERNYRQTWLNRDRQS